MHMRCILIFLFLGNSRMQMMSSKNRDIAEERMISLIEGVIFSLKSQKKSLVLDQTMIGLIHPHLWWTHFAEISFTINQSTLLFQPAHIGMKIA